MTQLVPCISLWQPWASLIFAGDKQHETRAYPFPGKYAGQRVAIHAAKALPTELSVGLALLCEQNWGGQAAWRRLLPRGAIIGTVQLVACRLVDSDAPSITDWVCGDWTPGRWAWQLDLPAELPSGPVPYRGKQGWFMVDPELINRRPPTLGPTPVDTGCLRRAFSVDP